MLSTSSLIVSASNFKMAVISSLWLSFSVNSWGVKAFEKMILIAEEAALWTRSVCAQRYSQKTENAIVTYLKISFFEWSSGFFIDAKFSVT
mgnify:CR=1 FL=1